MHLSALRIRGFKSFPEQVELRFFPGVAVIVGPNGSGKSNISDSLQWAMAASAAERDPRARPAPTCCSRARTARPAAGVCEVELVLDNSDGRIDLPQAEVSVMRRLHRDGTSEYLLGRRAVRRLEVQEALADAGIGRDLHCVISQGSVDEVLLARPEERRALIEEAAGLGKYQRRRRRARAAARPRARRPRARERHRARDPAAPAPAALQATAAERAEVIGREVAECCACGCSPPSRPGARRRRATLAGEREQARRRAHALSEAAAATRARREQAEGELAGLAAEQERASARAWGLASSLERLSDRRAALAERLAEAGREAEREASCRVRARAGVGCGPRRRDARGRRGGRGLVAEAEHADPRDDAALAAAATTRAEDALESALAARRAAGDAEAAAQRARAEIGRTQARVETLAAELAALATRDAEAQAALGPLAAAVAEAAPRAGRPATP